MKHKIRTEIFDFDALLSRAGMRGGAIYSKEKKIDAFIYYLGANIAYASWTSLWSSSSLNDCLCCLPTTTIILLFIFCNLEYQPFNFPHRIFIEATFAEWHCNNCTFIFSTSVLFQRHRYISIYYGSIFTSITWIVNDGWGWYNRSWQWTWHGIGRC